MHGTDVATLDLAGEDGAEAAFVGLGPLRLICRPEGWFVIGDRIVLPVDGGAHGLEAMRRLGERTEGDVLLALVD